MNPEEAVRAHRDASPMLACCADPLATFRLAPYPWSEPVERLLVAAGEVKSMWLFLSRADRK